MVRFPFWKAGPTEHGWCEFCHAQALAHGIAIKSHIFEGNEEENGWRIPLSSKSITYTLWSQLYLRDYSVHRGEERQKTLGKHYTKILGGVSGGLRNDFSVRCALQYFVLQCNKTDIGKINGKKGHCRHGLEGFQSGVGPEVWLGLTGPFEEQWERRFV